MKKLRLRVSDKMALALLKWSEFFIYFMPILPVIVLAYQGKGVTLGEFFLIQGLFRAVSFLMEIPSGYVSDVFSRKKVLLIGATIQFAAMVWLIWADGFYGVLLTEAGLGVAMALYSGTKEAYTFDLLKRMKRENQYVKENGNIRAFEQTGAFIGTLVGGTLFAISATLVLAIEAAFVLVAIPMIMLLPELSEVKRKTASTKNPLRDCLSLVKMSVKHPEIKWLMIFPAIYGSFTMILYWILQPMMEASLVPVALFGLFVGINMGSRALYSKIAHRLLKFFGVKKLICLLIALVAIGFAAVIGAVNANDQMAIVYAITAFVAVIPATQTMVQLVFNNYIHKRIESNERGTVLSVAQMFNVGITGAALIAAKPLLDNLGIEAAMIICIAALGLILWPLKKVLAIKGIENEK